MRAEFSIYWKSVIEYQCTSIHLLACLTLGVVTCPQPNGWMVVISWVGFILASIQANPIFRLRFAIAEGNLDLVAAQTCLDEIILAVSNIDMRWCKSERRRW